MQFAAKTPGGLAPVIPERTLNYFMETGNVFTHGMIMFGVDDGYQGDDYSKDRKAYRNR